MSRKLTSVEQIKYIFLFTYLNPIQAVVFWNYIGWGDTMCSPPFLHYLLSNYHHTWHDSIMAQNLLNSYSQIHNDVTMTHMTPFLLCCVSKTTYNSPYSNMCCFSSFIQSYSNLPEKFNTRIVLDQKVGFKIIVVSLVLMMSST